MLIVMKPGATEAQVEEVLKVIRDLGFKPHPMPGATRTAIGVTGNPGAIDPDAFRDALRSRRSDQSLKTL